MAASEEEADVVATPPTTPDWDHARRFLSTRLSGLLGPADRAHVEDLAQEALLSLVRISRKEQITNLDGMLSTLAERKYIDYLRRKGRWAALLAPWSRDAEDTAAHGWNETDPAERIAFMALEFFHSENSACEELHRHFLKGLEWGEVATGLGLNPATVRKRWERCLDNLRAAVATGILPRWPWHE